MKQSGRNHFLFLMIAVLTGIPACGPEEPSVQSERPGLAIFLIGNDHGMLRPCGCAKPVLGGISRRATLLKQHGKRGPILAFGNAISTGGRQQELKIETFLQAWEELGVKCYVVGDEDMHVGGSFWKSSASQMTRIPLVNCNLRFEDKRLFQTHYEVVVNQETAIVTGYVNPASPHLTDPSLQAEEDPVVAPIITALQSKDGSKRDLFLFGTGDEKSLSGFAIKSGLSKAARRVFLVRPGVSDIPTCQQRSSGTISIELGKKGRDVLEITWPFTGKSRRHTLDDSVTSDDGAESLLDFYRETVAFEELLSKVPIVGEVRGRYAGDEACKVCHPDAFNVWSESRHAHAFATLEALGDHRDPECVQCHVTGFARKGGFEPGRQDLVNVKCEACHGPSLKHVQTRAPTPGGRLGSNFCIQCHDLDNSPGFEFDVFWEKIAHK